ncbi:protein kinase domain-containing protein [Nonomuraea sp. KM88]|uniref:protein kinase domain-containing protein n=1 Tax=Nonomuraea sp. KM88 TaxID=3457427 RepID=UPI003FCDF028
MPNVEPLHEGDPAAVGPYRLVGRLGAGGHGVVYLGQARNGTPVAVKALREGIVMGGRLVKDIATARMVEPFCIARVLDASTSGRAYIVAEYVDGPSLQQAGRHAGVELQRLAVATATALDAIHQAGVLHGDFKPANVLLGPEGPQVVDFGIAAALGSGMKATSTIVGTPAYMAPEQLAGKPVGAPADVFAWASVIVFAATGVPPFGDDSLPVVINRIVNEEPQLGELPRPLREVVPACLAKDPAARPAMRDVLLHLTAPQRKGTPPAQRAPSAEATPPAPGAASHQGAASARSDGSTSSGSWQGTRSPEAEGSQQAPAYGEPYQTPEHQTAGRPARNDTPDWLWEQTPEPASTELAAGPGGEQPAHHAPGQEALPDAPGQAAWPDPPGRSEFETPGGSGRDLPGQLAFDTPDRSRLEVDSAAWQQTADQTLDQEASPPLGGTAGEPAPLGRVVGEPLPRRRTRSPQQGTAPGDPASHQDPGQAAYPSPDHQRGGVPHGSGREVQDPLGDPALEGPPQGGPAQGGPAQGGPAQDGSPLQALFDLSSPVESTSGHGPRQAFGQGAPHGSPAGFGAPSGHGTYEAQTGHGTRDEGQDRYGGQASEVPAWSEPPAPFAATQGLESAPFESQPHASAPPHAPESTHSVPAPQSSALVDALVAGERTSEAPPPRKRRRAKKVIVACVSGVCALALGGAIVWLTPTTPTPKTTRLAVVSDAPTAAPSTTRAERPRRSRTTIPQPDDSTGTGRATKGRLRLVYVRAGGTRTGDCWAGGEATLQALVERTGEAVNFAYTWYVDGSVIGRATAGISRNGRRYLAAPRSLTSAGGVHKVTLRITSPLTTQRTVSVTMCPQ